MSWISLEDHARAVLHVLEREQLRGPVNLCAPNPVTNAEYATALGRALHRPAVIPAPTWALDLLLGREMVREMLLWGQRVLPAKLHGSGFEYRPPTLDAALAEAIGTPA